MNLTITQENVHHLLPAKMTGMAAMYMEDNHVSMLDALRQLYRSQTYQQLEQEHTKLWHLGAVALYEQYQLDTL